MNLDSNKLFWIIIVLLIALVVAFVGEKVVVEKITNKVLQKLQREYSPSPYSPGIDPDKIDMDRFKK